MPGLGLGGNAAFETLLRTHEALVARTALRLLGNRQDAQDAAQEVFLRLHRGLGKIDDSRNVPGWLYRVTVNVCNDILRKRMSAGPLEDAKLSVPSSAEADRGRE